MSFNTWVALLIAGILISVSPGAGAVASMTAGMRHGVLRSFWTILGLQLGLLFQIAAVGFGVGALVARSEILFQTTKWFGVAYLTWLGIQSWRAQAQDMGAKRQTAPESAMRQIAQAFLVNITNPKAYLFMVAVLPQFLDSTKSVPVQFAIMAGTLIAVDFVVMNGYSLFSSQVARFLKSEQHQKYLNRFFGVLFFAVALALAFVRRQGN
jgi:homoserine/homoserine lactone efflux protein